MSGKWEGPGGKGHQFWFAASGKRQAASGKRQAASGKRQSNLLAASGKHTLKEQLNITAYSSVQSKASTTRGVLNGVQDKRRLRMTVCETFMNSYCGAYDLSARERHFENTDS